MATEPKPTAASPGAGARHSAARGPGAPRRAPRAAAPRRGAARPTVPVATRGAGPAGARRPGTSARPRTATPSERPATTPWVRGAILVSILVMLAVTLVPTLRSLIRQQSEIGAVRAKVVQQGQHVEALQNEQAQWTDPVFVEQQARERLKFVRVGDRSYTVIDPAEPTRGASPGALVPAPGANTSDPWYGQLWQSVKLADQPGAGMTPAPAQ